MLSLLAAASSAGSWCAVVGVPTLGALAAAESGIALDRLALVPNPGPEWPTVVAALIDGVDVVVIAVPGQVAASIASRLVARARQRGCVLVPYGRWDGADVTLQVTQGRWEGLGTGHGRLRRRKVTVIARGRGTAAWPKEITMWMPGLTAAPPRDPAPGTTESPRDPGSGTPGSLRDPASGTPEPSRFRPVAVPPPASVATAERSASVAGGALAADPPLAPVVAGGGPLASVTPILSAASAAAGAIPAGDDRVLAGGDRVLAGGDRVLAGDVADPASPERPAASAPSGRRSGGRVAGTGCA